MKLAILSCSPRCYSTRRLREAAEQRGFQIKVLNTLKFAIDLSVHVMLSLTQLAIVEPH